MPDFSRPEYASYVQLCRELGLKRPPVEDELFGKPWVHPDWEPFDQFELKGKVYNVAQAEDYQWASPNDDDAIWLPTLTDWLEMLETAAGLDHVTFFRNTGASWGSWTLRSYRKDVAGVLQDVEGPTREEAAARLWMAVKKG